MQRAAHGCAADAQPFRDVAFDDARTGCEATGDDEIAELFVCAGDAVAARRPFRYGNQLPEQIESAIVRAKREKPNWGARKVRERLLRSLPHAVKVPAASTIHAVLDRHGLVSRPTRSRTRTEGTPLSQGLQPNDLWCTDYKGEFMLADKRYCYPLTVTDHASRYLLLCEAMESNAEKPR